MCVKRSSGWRGAIWRSTVVDLCGKSELQSELNSDEVIPLFEFSVRIAVLDLSLEIIGETITKRSVNAPGFRTPRPAFAVLRADAGKELLVPAQRAKKLRSDFVFGFQIISENIGVSDARNLEARFKKFRP